MDVAVSVLIPVYNGEKFLGDLLKLLQKQTVRCEPLIVDSSSSDRTAVIAKSYGAKIVTIPNKQFDHGTTRNLAASNIQTEFMVFLTQDAIPADEYTIANLIKPMLLNPNIAICYGRQLPSPDDTALEHFARSFNYPPTSTLKTKNDINALGLKTFFCSNSCSAIRLPIFRKLGGFKNNVIVNEDMLFAARAILEGYSVWYAADAMVYHSHSYSLPKIFDRYFKIGRFFADNDWLLKYASVKNYGTNMLAAGIKHFRQQGTLLQIPLLFIEFAVKTSAYKIGWHYQQHLFLKHKH